MLISYFVSFRRNSHSGGSISSVRGNLLIRMVFRSFYSSYLGVPLHGSGLAGDHEVGLGGGVPADLALAGLTPGIERSCQVSVPVTGEEQ